MRLYARPGSPRLYADLIHPTSGKRVRISSGETEQRAARKAALATLAAWQREADETQAGHPPITLNAALDAYVASLAGRASHSHLVALALKATGRHPNMPGRWHLDGSRWLHSLTPADMEELAQARKAEGNGAQTVAHELKVLRTATRLAASLGKRAPELLTSAAVQNAWRTPEVPTKTRYLSTEEFWQLHRYLDPARELATRSKFGAPAAGYALTGERRAERQDAQDMLVVLAMTGARWGEVIGLTWGQVDLAAKVIRLWGSKTERERLVPITELALKVLLRRAEGARKPGPVFPGVGGGFRGASSCKPILRAIEACGLNADPEMVARHGRATVHSLRHTFASLLLQHGAGLSEVQEALGHSSLDMTRRYAHLSQHEATQRLGAILTGVVG